MIIVEKNRFSGFSLIELIVVVLLLGILSVFAMGRLFDQNQFAARGFFDDTVNAVKFAQKLAVSTGCEVRVTFAAPPTTGYRLEQRKGTCSGGFGPVAHPANRSNDYENNAIAGLNVPSTTITFDAQGLVANDVTVVFDPGVPYRFRVYAETGLVDVF